MRRVAFGLAACLVVVAAATWILVPVRYEAYALLRVASGPTDLQAEKNRADYDTFKRTQAGLVTSGAVLKSALRDKDVAETTTIAQHQDDATAFLRSALTVSFPDDSEIMRVSMAGTNEDDLEVIVDTVVKKYLTEIVQREIDIRLDQETKLEKTYNQLYAEYEAALKSLHILQQLEHHSGSKSVQMRKQLATDDLRELQAQRTKINDEIRETRLQITLAHAAEDLAQGNSAFSETVKNSHSTRLPLPLLEKQQEFLEEQLNDANKQIARQSEAFAGLENDSAKVAAKQDELETMQRSLNELRAELNRTKVRRLAPSAITKVDDAQLTSARGNEARRNLAAGATLLAALALFGVGLLLPGRKSA